MYVDQFIFRKKMSLYKAEVLSAIYSNQENNV